MCRKAAGCDSSETGTVVVWESIAGACFTFVAFTFVASALDPTTMFLIDCFSKQGTLQDINCFFLRTYRYLSIICFWHPLSMSFDALWLVERVLQCCANMSTWSSWTCFPEMETWSVLQFEGVCLTTVILAPGMQGRVRAAFRGVDSVAPPAPPAPPGCSKVEFS